MAVCKRDIKHTYVNSTVVAGVNGVKQSISCNSDPYGGSSICMLARVEKEVVENDGTVYINGHPSEPSDSEKSSGKPQAGSCLPPAVFYGRVI